PEQSVSSPTAREGLSIATQALPRGRATDTLYIRETSKRQNQLKTQTLLESPHAVARDGQFRAAGVPEADEQPAAEPRMHFVNVIRVEQDRPVDADEFVRVEFLFEFGNGPVHDEVPFSRRRISQFVLREKMRDLREVEEPDPLAEPGGDARRPDSGLRTHRRGELLDDSAKVGLLRRAAHALNLVERAFQLRNLDGLQEVINRIHLEGAERIFIVSGREDDERLLAESGEQLEAVHLGHLNVEEERVNPFRRESVKRRFGIRLLPRNLDATGFAQQPRQALERQLLVVNQKNTQRCGRTHIRAPSDSAERGIETVATVNLPSARMPKDALSAKSAASRDCRLSSPCPAGISSAVKPGPSSWTSSLTRPLSALARSRISPPSRRGATQYLMLFSTSVCSENGSTSTVPSSPGTSTLNLRRWPKRARSISR